MNDRRRLYLAAFARALATGLIGVLLAVYLARIGLDASTIGFVVSAGLAGAATGTLIVTFPGRRLGHRLALTLSALLAAAGGVALAAASHPWALGVAAFFGMVNGMGRDRGAALVVEQAVLPTTVEDSGRTMAFARYNVVQDAGHALGGLMGVVPSLFSRAGVASADDAYRLSVLVYAGLVLLPVAAYLGLSRAVDGPATKSRVRVSPATRRVLWRISSLFALDSIGGGFLTTALVAFFFYERFGVGLDTIGPLFFVARLANALSHFGAAWLARRIGLVRTMVFTHIPSSLLLVTVAFAPTFPIAAALFVLRESLVEMDVPTRQSYVMAVVRPEERAVASGVTHLVRMGAWAVAPLFAGMLMEGVALMVPLLVGAGLKIGYDLLLWRAFRDVRPPEER